MAKPTTSQPSGRSMDLGILQKEVEAATRKLKAANATLQKATAVQQAEEQNYITLQKSMAAAIVQFQAATKIV